MGVLGRVRGVLTGRLVSLLYNGLVLPHLQYCLMVWGDFEADRNVTRAAALLKAQRRFVGFMAGIGGRYHADPLFARFGVLKVGDLYKQQLRLFAWRFWNGRLPENQAAMLTRVSDQHGYGTRSAGLGLVVGSGDHRVVAYKVPVEWSLPAELRQAPTLGAFREGSKRGFLAGYGAFRCGGCWVCAGRDG